MDDAQILNVRDRILEQVEEGGLCADDLLLCCLKWMGTDDILNMLRANEISLEPDLCEEFI